MELISRKPRTGIIHANMPMQALAWLFLKEGRGRLDELRPAGADDGAVARVGDNPEAGMRDGFAHFDGEFNWIQRIAVALNDERVGLNRGEKGRREIQVVVAGGEGLGADKDGFDLRVTAGMGRHKISRCSSGRLSAY